MKSKPHMEEKDAEYSPSESSSEERNSKSSKEGSPIYEICQDVHSSIYSLITFS